MSNVISDIADTAFDGMARHPDLIGKFLKQTDADKSSDFQEFLLAVNGGHFFTRKGDAYLDQDGLPGEPGSGLSYVSISAEGTKVVTF